MRGGPAGKRPGHAGRPPNPGAHEVCDVSWKKDVRCFPDLRKNPSLQPRLRSNWGIHADLSDVSGTRIWLQTGVFRRPKLLPAKALRRVRIKQFARSVPQVCSSFLRTSTGLRTEDPEAADAELDGCRRRPCGHRNPCRGVAGTGGRWVGFGRPQPVIQRTSSLPCPHIRRPPTRAGSCRVPAASGNRCPIFWRAAATIRAAHVKTCSGLKWPSSVVKRPAPG